jgi:serine/threonine protein kinase
VTPAPDALFTLGAGRYAVEARLGVGAGGEVYAGRDLMLERPVAIKRLPAGSVASTQGAAGAPGSVGVSPSGTAALDEAAARLLTEARAIARLSHPNIVAVFDVFYEEGRLHLVLERVPGQTLRQRLDSGGPLPLDHFHALATQLAAALAHAHAQGVVHRDLKPENVLLAPGGAGGAGVARLVDFGIARVAGTERLTHADVAVGTPAYVSPEQARGEPLDGRADLYSLGCLLYEAATGRPPFVADDPLYVVGQHLYGVAAAPSTLRPSLPAAWEALIVRLLAKSPADRYPSADALAGALQGLPAATPVGAAPVERGSAPARAQPLVLAVDDDRDLAEVTEFVLKRDHYDTVIAYDGATAWDRFLEHRPDLVILDLDMPGLSGLELLRRIRAQSGPSAATPVVMLTARTDEATVVECLDAGANDYISKPFSPRQLLARLRAALRLTRS